MTKLFKNPKENEIFPVLIKWKNILFFTGYYYDENDNDCLFHTLNNIECFKTMDDLKSFCEQNNLILNNELAEFDFDKTITNPIYYNDVLNKWNILNTISLNLHINFEGNKLKYNDVYNYLFAYCFAKEPLPALYEIPYEYFNIIKYIFEKQSEILKSIKYY